MVGGRRWGRRVVRVKVRAWKREKTMYGRRVTVRWTRVNKKWQVKWISTNL